MTAVAGETRTWALRWKQAWFAEGDPEPTIQDKLVVFDAPTAEEASRLSGFVVEEFTEATEDDIEEWETLIERPLLEREVETLRTLVRAELRDVGRRRLRDRVKGRWEEGTDLAYDRNRGRAFYYLRILEKLDQIETEDGAR